MYPGYNKWMNEIFYLSDTNYKKWLDLWVTRLQYKLWKYVLVLLRSPLGMLCVFSQSVTWVLLATNMVQNLQPWRLVDERAGPSGLTKRKQQQMWSWQVSIVGIFTSAFLHSNSHYGCKERGSRPVHTCGWWSKLGVWISSRFVEFLDLEFKDRALTWMCMPYAQDIWCIHGAVRWLWRVVSWSPAMHWPGDWWSDHKKWICRSCT